MKFLSYIIFFIIPTISHFQVTVKMFFCDIFAYQGYNCSLCKSDSGMFRGSSGGCSAIRNKCLPSTRFQMVRFGDFSISLFVIWL